MDGEAAHYHAPPPHTTAFMRIALLTPTFARDLAHFRVLRKSLEAAGCHWPHYVVVQTEHFALFAAESWAPEVILLRSAEVLPPEVEAQRLKVAGYSERTRKWRRSLNKRFGWFADASSDGWNAQQIIKLGMSASDRADAWLVLDSDVLVTGEVRLEAICNPDLGLVALHTQLAESHAHFAPHWNHAARQLLGLSEPDVEHNYVAHPFVFSRQVTKALLAHLEARYQQPWWRVLGGMRANSLSEFSLYGIYAREVGGMAGLYEVPANQETFWIYLDEHRARAAQIVQSCFEEAATNYLVIQAHRHHPIEPLVPVIEEALAARAARLGAPQPG